MNISKYTDYRFKSVFTHCKLVEGISKTKVNPARHRLLFCFPLWKTGQAQKIRC